MMQKDTPPSSPDMEFTDEEDVVHMDEIDEVIDVSRAANAEEEDAMDEDVPEKVDATCVFDAHKPGSVFCGSLSKDGQLAATGGEKDMGYVWDTTSGDIVLECTGHKDSVIFAEFSFTENYVATGDMSGIIQVWDMTDKTCIWDYNMGDAIWMKWHTAANVLFAGSVSGEIYMWKIPDGDCKVFQGYGCRAEVGALFSDGKRIAVGYEDGSIRVIDLKTNSVLSNISPEVGHSATVTALDCHSDNNLIISGAVDGLTILSTSTGKVVSVLQNFYSDKSAKTDEDPGNSDDSSRSNWVETAAFCKDPGFQVAATGTLNGEIFIWDISKQVLRQTMNQESGISKLVWKGTTSIVFSAGLDGVLRCYDAKTSQCLRSFEGHTADILDLYISENGEKALTASDDYTARIFDISSFS